MARAAQPTTVEQATAGVATAREALATIQERVNAGLTVTASELAAGRDLLQLAEMTLEAAQGREEAAERAAVEQRQADVTAALHADPMVTNEARQKIIADTAAKIVEVFRTGAQQLAERDEYLTARSAEATAAGLPEAFTPAWASTVQHVAGLDLQPYRNGLLVGGQEVLPEPPLTRQRRLSDAVLKAVTEAAGRQPYTESQPAEVPFMERPVQEATEHGGRSRRRTEGAAIEDGTAAVYRPRTGADPDSADTDTE